MFTLFGTCATPPSLGPKKQEPSPSSLLQAQASTLNKDGGGLFSLGGSSNTTNPLAAMLGRSTFHPPKGKEGKKALRLLGNVSVTSL